MIERAFKTVTDLLPVLMGYDAGYPTAVDLALRAFGIVVAVLAVTAMAGALREACARRSAALILLLLFAATNLAVAVIGLPYVPGNPRYILFLTAPIAIFLAGAQSRRPWLMALIVSVGALASLAQSVGAVRADGRWRDFVRGLETEGVRFCYTDFYLAAKINFLSEERIACSAKLGPTTAEYFLEYRTRVERAPEAALVAVNATSAEKIERRLARLGVTYVRRDLMKPVLLRLSRKVDPEELFPGKMFPAR